MLGRLRICGLAVLIVGLLLIGAGRAAADGSNNLTGSVTVSYLYPTSSSAITTDTLGVGSTISCPGSSALCALFDPSSAESVSVGVDSVTFTATGTTESYSSASFNGLEFSGLTFASGGYLGGFTLTTDIAGLTASDVTFTGSSISINLSGLPASGTFTLSLLDPVNTPEPGTLGLLGVGLLGLLGLCRKKALA